MFAAHATAMKYIGLRESPMPRNIELITLYAVMNGMPMKQTVRYARAPSAASAGVDMTETIGEVSASSSAVSTSETPTKSTAVFPMYPAARSRRLPPTDCPTQTVVPIASPTIITVSMCMTCEPIETAVVSETVPYLPIISRSAIPYSVCRKYDSRYGSEKPSNFLTTLPSVRFFSIAEFPFYRAYFTTAL